MEEKSKITIKEIEKLEYEHIVAAIESYRKDVEDWKNHNNATYFIYYKNEYYPSREIVRRAYEIYSKKPVDSDSIGGKGGKGKEKNQKRIGDILEEKKFIVISKKEKKYVAELQKAEVECDANFINEINKESMPDVYMEYIPRPEKKSEPLEGKGRIVYTRRKEISINALKRANHLCEIDDKHPGFIRKSDGTNYTEPHHLIPMHMQWYFENSLDVEANITSLCSNCHNLLHYGADKEEVLKSLYDLRKKELKEAGIEISFDKLLSMYT